VSKPARSVTRTASSSTFGTPYLPQGEPAKKWLKPVKFQIYGGGPTGGTGSDPSLEGGNLASRGDAMVVTINDRLLTLGFLALDDGVTNGEL